MPPFPVDEQTLDLLWASMHPDPDTSERTSLWDFCELMSQMAGSDTAAVEADYGTVREMRDPAYSHMDVIDALIIEVRRLRAIVDADG